MTSALQWKRLHRSILSKLQHKLSALGSKYWLNWITLILNSKLQLVGANLAPTSYDITRIDCRDLATFMLQERTTPRGNSPAQDTDTIDCSNPDRGTYALIMCCPQSSGRSPTAVFSGPSQTAHWSTSPRPPAAITLSGSTSLGSLTSVLPMSPCT